MRQVMAGLFALNSVSRRAQSNQDFGAHKRRRRLTNAFGTYQSSRHLQNPRVLLSSLLFNMFQSGELQVKASTKRADQICWWNIILCLLVKAADDWGLCGAAIEFDKNAQMTNDYYTKDKIRQNF